MMVKTAQRGVLYKGRGAGINTANRFIRQFFIPDQDEISGELPDQDRKTKYYEENPAKIINPVDSPDIPMPYSMNPYQGCEHGCVYCYARPTHEYWSFSAALDFERNIIVKKNAPAILRKQLESRSWKPAPIMFSGNTDCYQPVERKLGITREMLEVLYEFRQPVGMITKNSLILRDLDILSEMAKLRLVKVMVSITTLDEDLRMKMEPRTVTAAERLRVIKELTDAGVATGVMNAPVIPGLNSMEIPKVIQRAADAGAVTAGYTMLRLNGSVGEIFTNWLEQHYPDKKDKVLNQVREAHGGSLSDSRFGTRMKGEGAIAEGVRQLFRSSVNRFLSGRSSYELDSSQFRVPGYVQAKLF